MSTPPVKVTSYQLLTLGMSKELTQPALRTESLQAYVEASNSAIIDLSNVPVGSVGGGNLLSNSSFEADTNGDGVPDSWAGYANGETVTVSVLAGGKYGGKFARVAWSVANTGGKGLVTTSIAGGWRQNAWYVVSFYARASGTNVGHACALTWNTPPNDAIDVANPPLTADWQRYAFRIRWTTTVPANELYLSIAWGTGTTGTLDLDAAQAQEATTPSGYAPRVGEILPGTVTNTELGDLSVDTSKLANQAISNLKLGDLAVTAEKVAFGAIKAQHIVLAPKSLNLDPSFETGAAGWQGFVRRLPRADAAVPANCPMAYASEFNFRDCYSNATIPVVPGEKYKVSGYVNKGTGVVGASAGLGIVGIWVDDQGGYGGFAAISGYTAAGWLLASAEVTIPALSYTGRPVVGFKFGPWADRGTYTGESWFTDFHCEKKADASLIVDGSITSAKVNTNGLQVGYTEATGTIYPENVSGQYATAGAKIAAATGTPILVAPGGMRIGRWKLDEISTRVINSISTNGQAGADLRAWYRGSNDPAVNGGAPGFNTGAVSVVPFGWGQIGTTGMGCALFILTFQPYAGCNWDGLRYMQVVLLNQSAAGTSGFLVSQYSAPHPLGDRRYGNATLDGDASNQYQTTVLAVRPNLYGVCPAAQVQLIGATGTSPMHCFYSPSGWGIGTPLVDNGTSWPAGLTGATGGGGGGGSDPGLCVDPDTLITMAGGVLKRAGDVRPGDLVYTRREDAGSVFMEGWCVAKVSGAVLTEAEERWGVRTDAGVFLIASTNHRVLTAPGSWAHVQDLQPGDALFPGSARVTAVEPLGPGSVVQLTVPGPATYLSNGILSHNAKIG